MNLYKITGINLGEDVDSIINDYKKEMEIYEFNSRRTHINIKIGNMKVKIQHEIRQDIRIKMFNSFLFHIFVFICLIINFFMLCYKFAMIGPAAEGDSNMKIFIDCLTMGVYIFSLSCNVIVLRYIYDKKIKGINQRLNRPIRFTIPISNGNVLPLLDLIV